MKPSIAYFVFLVAGPLTASDFSFYSIIRAGALGGQDWEGGTGPNGNSITTGAYYNYSNSVAGWSNNLDQRFRIGYSQATNTAYTTVWGSGISPIAYTSSYQPVGGTPLNSSGTWTINAGALYVRANTIPVATSITVSQLQLASGLTVLQPLTSTSLFASQPTGAVIESNSAPIVFSATANGGDWFIDGVIRFNGLSPYVTGGAQRSQLQFSLTAVAQDSPEPATFVLTSAGLLTMAYLRRRRHTGAIV